MLTGTRSVRYKLLLVVVATTLSALVISGVAMVLYDLHTYQQSWVNDLSTQADILGRASAPALTFDDPKAATENLALLKARPQISAAAIYTARGGLFATYVHGMENSPFPKIPDVDGYRIEGKELIVFKRIAENNEILGTVYLRAHYELYGRLRDYLGILIAVMIVSLLAALLLSYRLNAVVIKPILAISEVARQVMENRDFSLRAQKTTEDEIGYLVDGFNGMLIEIGRRAGELEESNRVLQREITERRGAEAALQIGEQRNRTLVAAITSVVWTADGTGNFTEEQPLWSLYTGQDSATYHGLGWRDAFEVNDRNTLDLAWARAISAPVMFELELQLWHAKSQRYRYISIRAVPVLEAQGAVHEWIGTVSDIDDQRHAEKELRTLNAELERRVADRTAELEASNKDLESFSYSVSHDLRAPVRAVAGFSKLLWSAHASQLDEEARRKLDIIMSEAQRMGVLIDDLLAFARLGRQAIQTVELDMQEIVRNLFERLQAQHQGPKVEFRLGALPRVMGDRVLLEQVWANFLSNALKFSAKRDKPLIEVGAVSDEKEHIYFIVDNGAGFDPRYQAKLFGVFQRLHSTAEFAGNGVGLALVHRIVTRHGGRVWADSKPDEGAKFYFALPKEQTNG